ncbi:n-acetylglutamate synthase [Dyadobacter luticola]|uniref:N-acetylglutamate synthase n=1 Tax=Dyadobacter luticola TaxID=1979387 RepID=A0A5R9KX30_9BACT|nr:n-acetylglutamate synthase [Dyadobacter luticola]TLV00823.1 n-acetylglutamate synthase [Dyadobacter luticola]
MINYNNRIFKAVSNSENGEVETGMEFLYHQSGNIVTSTYHGDSILYGHLIALVDENGGLDMRYHQVNLRGELMTGICKSTPEIMSDGKIRLHEKWKWTSGDMSEGDSMLEEK